MRSLRQCLLDTDAVVLRIIAERWSLSPIGLKPRELVDRLEETISTPAHATAILDDLPDAEREALRALLAAGGTLPVANFSQRFGSIRSVGPARLERDQLWRNPISPAENLWYLGLLYRGFEQLPNGAMREVFFAPAELTPLLPLLKAPDRSIEPLEITATPADMRSSGEALADDVCTVLSHLHNNFVRAAEPHWRAVIEPLRLQLRDAHPTRLEFLLHHAERARLIRIAGQRLRPDPQRCADWLRAPALDQLRVLFEAWRSNATWNDLQRSNLLHIEKTAALRGDAVAVRSAILAGLPAAVPGAWHTFATLLARVKAQSPDFLRTDFDTDYVRDAATGEYLQGFAAWDRVEGALIQYALTGPLFWLGIIDVDVSTTSFCVTARGAQLLGIAHEAGEAAGGDRLFIVRGDATIHVSTGRRYDRFQVARVADLVAVVAAEADDEYRYRLTPSSLTRANSQKISTEKVLAYLQQAADQGVPPMLAKAIQRWAGKGTEVKVERAVIVQVKDAAILKRLQESPKTRGLAIEPLGPTAARINEKDWPKLVAILAEAGVLVD